MEYLLPILALGAPHPLPRVKHRTRSANSKKSKRRRHPSGANATRTFLKRRISRPRSI